MEKSPSATLSVIMAEKKDDLEGLSPVIKCSLFTRTGHLVPPNLGVGTWNEILPSQKTDRRKILEDSPDGYYIISIIPT